MPIDAIIANNIIADFETLYARIIAFRINIKKKVAPISVLPKPGNLITE